MPADYEDRIRRTLRAQEAAFSARNPLEEAHRAQAPTPQWRSRAGIAAIAASILVLGITMLALRQPADTDLVASDPTADDPSPPTTTDSGVEPAPPADPGIVGLDLAEAMDTAQRVGLTAEFVFSFRPHEAPYRVIARSDIDPLQYEVAVPFDPTGFAWGSPIEPPPGYSVLVTRSDSVDDRLEVSTPDASWEHTSPELGEVLHAGSTLVALTSPGEVSARAIATGEHVWTFPLASNEIATHFEVADRIALIGTRELSAEPSGPTRVIAVPLESGVAVWESELGRGSELQLAPFTLHEDAVFVATVPTHAEAGPAMLYAIGLSTGEIRWSQPIANTGADTRHGVPPVVVGSTTVALGPDGRLSAYLAAAGQPLWTRDDLGFARPIGTTADNELIVEADDQRIRVDLATGASQ